MQPKLHVISVGGSIIAPPSGIDITYLKKLKALIAKLTRSGHRFVIVTGGGATARNYIEAAKRSGISNSNDLDWIGIAATRINAELVRSVFGQLTTARVVIDPTKPIQRAKVIVAGGWKPGWSTDFVATKLAQKLGAVQVINLSNIKYVYDKDPNKYKSAKPIKEISWRDFKKIVGGKWDPGANLPFDPIASKLAASSGIEVVLANGKNLKNLEQILKNKPFIGTKIG